MIGLSLKLKGADRERADGLDESHNAIKKKEI